MNHSTRIVVVGAGIVGASVAYHLARRGVTVVVIEGVEAGPATGAGAGIICPWTSPVDDPAYRLGADGARYYPELISLLAEDGEAGTGYRRVGALCLTGEPAHIGTGARTGGTAADRMPLREIEAHVPRARGRHRSARSSARPPRAVDPQAAAPACLAIACDGTVGDEVRLSAAEQLAAIASA